MRSTASCGGLGGARHDRPVDQREERELVARGIEADGIAGFQRGARRQKQRQSGHAGLDNGIHVGIAHHDVGEARLRHRLDGELVAFAGKRARGRRRPSFFVAGEAAPAQARAARPRAPPRSAARPAAEQSHHHAHRSGTEPAPTTAEVPRRSPGSALLTWRAARAGAEVVKRRRRSAARERVDGDQALGGSVEAGRMVRRCAVAHNPPAAAWRSTGGGPNAPKPSSVRGGATVSAVVASLATPAPGVDGVAGHVDHPPQHVDEGAGQRQVRPARCRRRHGTG